MESWLVHCIRAGLRRRNRYSNTSVPDRTWLHIHDGSNTNLSTGKDSTCESCFIIKQLSNFHCYNSCPGRFFDRIISCPGGVVNIVISQGALISIIIMSKGEVCMFIICQGGFKNLTMSRGSQSMNWSSTGGVCLLNGIAQ